MPRYGSLKHQVRPVTGHLGDYEPRVYTRYDGTVPAVPGIIGALKERGYVFVTVPRLPAPGTAEPGEVYR